MHQQGLARIDDVVPLQADCIQAVLHLRFLFLSTQIHNSATVLMPSVNVLICMEKKKINFLENVNLAKDFDFSL